MNPKTQRSNEIADALAKAGYGYSASRSQVTLDGKPLKDAESLIRDYVETGKLSPHRIVAILAAKLENPPPTSSGGEGEALPV